MLADFFSPEPRDSFEVVHSAACRDPAESIVDYARKNNVDLIMLPTRGHGIFHRTLLGLGHVQDFGQGTLPGLDRRAYGRSRAALSRQVPHHCAGGEWRSGRGADHSPRRGVLSL